jgi:hypothetical protein
MQRVIENKLGRFKAEAVLLLIGPVLGRFPGDSQARSLLPCSYKTIIHLTAQNNHNFHLLTHRSGTPATMRLEESLGVAVDVLTPKDLPPKVS